MEIVVVIMVREEVTEMKSDKECETVAPPVDVDLIARRQQARSRFDEICQKIAAGFADIPEEEGMAMIDRIVYEERHR